MIEIAPIRSQPTKKSAGFSGYFFPKRLHTKQAGVRAGLPRRRFEWDFPR